MAPHPLTRRSFLAAAGGLLVVAACGDDDGNGGADGSQPNGGATVQGLRISSDLYVSTDPQRFAFALAEGSTFLSTAGVSIAFRAPDGKTGAPVAATPRTEGLPEGRAVYTVRAVLPQEGIWDAFVDVDGRDVTFPFQVTAEPIMPVEGSAAPGAPSPTTADPMGVDPLCTREPPCPLHDVSLDAAIGQGTPVVVMFATPARCQTRYCGPVLDQLLPLAEEYGDRVTFVHVEVYQNLTTDDLVSTVVAWGLESEPWLFGIDGAGNVAGRLDGAFSSDEIRELIDGLTA